MTKIKKVILSTILILTILTTFNVSLAYSSCVDETKTNYMQLIIDSLLERDFESAEHYTELRNEKIVTLELDDTYQPFVWDDVFCMTCVIYQEAGGGICVSDDEMLAQANVVQNRIADTRFPNSIREVLEQTKPIQYANFGSNGVNLVNRGDSELELDAIKRSFYIALKALNGDKAVNDDGEECPDNVVYASLSKQGDGVWWETENGTYFCYS